MNPCLRAQVPLGATGRGLVERAHERAKSFGANFTGNNAESERLLSTQDLLCAAGEAVVDLVMVAQVFHAQTFHEDDEPSAAARDLSRTMKDAAAGVSRYTARALEVHARDTGYSPEVWILDAVDETERLMTADRDPLFEPTVPTVTVIARLIATDLFAALAAAPGDRMGVPEHVSRALGASVALFMVAEGTIHDDRALRST